MSSNEEIKERAEELANQTMHWLSTPEGRRVLEIAAEKAIASVVKLERAWALKPDAWMLCLTFEHRDMCKILLSKLEREGAGVIDDDMREYAREIASDKDKSRDFLIRAGILDEHGKWITRDGPWIREWIRELPE